MGRYSATEVVTERNDERSKATSVRVLRSPTELEQVRSTWVSWQHHPNSDLDFYLTIISSRPEIVRPHVMVVYRDGSPDALLIGRLEHTRFDLKIGYKSLYRPKCHSLTFIYEGLLGNRSAENSKVLLEEVMRSLRHEEADLAFFNSLRVDSPIYGFAKSLPGFLRRDNSPNRREHWTMKLPRTVEEFYLGLSPKARRNRRQEANKLLRDHSNKVQVRCLREIDDVEQMSQDIEEVAKKTYHRSLGVGFQDSVEMRRRLHLDAQQGRLRAYILYVDAKPCAFWLATLYGRTLHGRFTGYDPDFAKYSPGTFILLRVIEDSCGTNVEEIDFGLGDAWYKEFFCNYNWHEASLYIFAPTLKGLGLNLLRTPIMVVDKTARRVLGQTKLLARVKRAWRNLVLKDGARVGQQRKEIPRSRSQSD